MNTRNLFKNIFLKLIFILLISIGFIALKSSLAFGTDEIPKVYFNGDISQMLEKSDERKITIKYESNDVNFDVLTDDASIKLIKLIENFDQIIINSIDKNEPSIIARYSIDVAKAYSTFYNQNKIISDDKQVTNARLYLTYMTKVTLENSLKLLGIEVPDKM